MFDGIPFPSRRDLTLAELADMLDSADPRDPEPQFASYTPEDRRRIAEAFDRAADRIRRYQDALASLGLDE